MYVWSPLPRTLGATLRDSQSHKPRVRLSSIEDLVRWAEGEERTRCIAQLVALLEQDPDLEVRAAAALGLADAGARESLPALVAAAEHAPPRVRQMSLVSLGELAAVGDAAALAAVRSSLDSELPALRFQALVAAHRLFDEASLPVELERALADVEPKVRYVACRVSEERYFANAVSPPAELFDALGRALADEDAAVALAAAIPLARAGSEQARQHVVRYLNGGRRTAQLEDEQAAIELCAEIGLLAAQPGLGVRAWGGMLGGISPLAFQARVALARLGDERASHQILQELSSWSRATRTRAVAAAGQARLEAARARLLEMRANERQADPESVSEALRSLDLAATGTPAKSSL
jgi:HEAT repeat protein